MSYKQKEEYVLAYTVRYCMGRALDGSIDARRLLCPDVLEFLRPICLGFGAASTSSSFQWMRTWFCFASDILTLSSRDSKKRVQGKNDEGTERERRRK
jgi:hypothetical protein